MISYDCPGCRTRLDTPADAAGRMIECPDCGAESLVPAPPGAAEPDLITEIRFSCSSCRASFRTPIRQAGKKAECTCGALLLIPSAVSTEELPARVLSRKAPPVEEEPEAVKWSPALPPLNPRPKAANPEAEEEARDEPRDDDETDLALDRRKRDYRRRVARRRLLTRVALFLVVSVTAIIVGRKALIHMENIREQKRQHELEFARADTSKPKEVNHTPPLQPKPQPAPAKKEELSEPVPKGKVIVPPEREPVVPAPKNENPPPKQEDFPVPKPKEGPRPAPEPLTVPKAPPPDPALVKVNALIKDLSSKNAKTRLAAIEGLEQLGSTAAPAAKDLCDIVSRENNDVAKRAFIALESITPELYKPLSKLLLDQIPQNQALAAQELGKLGEDARPAVSIMINVLRKSCEETYPRLTGVDEAIFAALKSINPDDSATIKSMTRLASAVNNSVQHRYLALTFMVRWAGEDEAHRKEVFPLVQAGLNVEKEYFLIGCIDVAGEYGVLANATLPRLKQLKLSMIREVREAATKAVAKIEGK